MTEKETKSCIQTINLLRRLALNVHGVIDIIDDRNCNKIIEMLRQEQRIEHSAEQMDETTEMLERIIDENDEFGKQILSDKAIRAVEFSLNELNRHRIEMEGNWDVCNNS